MKWKEKLKEKIEKGREFNDKLRELGVKTEFDEKSGEISFKMSDFKPVDINTTNETKGE